MKSQQMTEDSRAKSTLLKNFEDLSSEKEKSIREMMNRFEQRENEFR